MSGYICLEITPSENLTECSYTFYELINESERSTACLAQEVPLSITFNGVNHSVMMLTPADIADFIVGFSLSYQIIAQPNEILDMQLKSLGEALQVDVTLNNRALWQFKANKRELAGSTGCGLCGVSAVEHALPQLTPLSLSELPKVQYLQGLRERIQPYQVLAEKSGALHAALFFDAQGEVVLCREDIGRHNALDKLIGALHRQKIACDQGFVVMTSRSSLELLQKTVRAGIHTLVSLSAPSSLTVDWARKHNLNLIHVPHKSPARVYSPE